MKKIFSLFIFFLSGTLVSQTFNMSNSTQNITCGTTYTFYDSGGPGSNYNNGENFTLVMNAGTAGQCLQLTVNGFTVQNNGNDNLSIYQGSSVASGTLIGTYFGGAAAPPPSVITSTVGSLTFVFSSNANNNFAGWDISVACVACSTPTTGGSSYNMNNTTVNLTCPSTSTFYDSGGPSGQYGNGENFVKTFNAPAGSCLSVVFGAFSTESCCDELYIYDGPTTGSPLIGTYFGTNSPGTITSSGTSLTFSFTSDFSITDAGWTSTITCQAPCSGVSSGGTSAITPSSSCTTFTSNLTLTGASTGCGITYQWQSASALAGPYTNIAGATSVSTTVTSNATTYYRCVVSCGSSSVASTVSTASISAVGSCALCSMINIASLPFTSNGQTTCGQGNDITSSNVTNVCNSTFYYGGEDVVYSFTPAASGAVTVGVTSTGSYMGIMLYNGCPISGGTCSGYAQSSAGNQSMCVSVTAGQVYYLIIDSWPSPTCNPYNVSISGPTGCSGSISGAVAAASPTAACGTLTTNLSLSGFSACGPSFQWQSSTSAGGPFSNIAGATSQNITVTTTVSTYYRALLTCGASTALSTVVQTSVQPFTPPTCGISTYTASTKTYSFETFVGTVLPTTDDVLFTTSVPFGFNFCFGGNQYTQGYVASNTSFVFDGVPCFPNIQTSTYAAGGVGTGYTIPNPAPVNGTSVPRNAILGPWQDAHPGLGGTMRYGTLGTAPNRRFVVSFENIPMFSCGTSSPAIYFTGQIKLFETTQEIEIHIGNKGVCPGWINGQAILGLHSYDGTVYVPPVNSTMHNATSAAPYNQWSMTNTAYRFAAPCATSSGPCAILPIGFKSFYGVQENNVNKLYWETEYEKNVADFIIERSSDGSNFKEIAHKIPNNQASKYEYNDVSFRMNSINYYRITSVDYDGSKSRTQIYSLGTLNDIGVSELFPNPSDNSFSVSLITKAEMKVAITIKDMYGRQVRTSAHEAGVGVNTLTINSTDIATGFYIVEISDLTNNRMLSQQKMLIRK